MAEKSVGTWEELEKIKKALGKTAVEELDSLKEADLRDTVVTSEHNLQSEIQKFENDDAFQLLKNKFKEAAGPLRDAKKFQKAKIRYALHRLEEMGKL